MDQSNLKISSTIQADIIFCSCSPSFAVLLLDVDALTMEECTFRAERVQSVFRNCAAFFIGSLSLYEWEQIQNQIGFGCLRLFKVTTMQDALQYTFSLKVSLEQKRKQEVQHQYFANLKTLATTSSTARRILLGTFHEMEIPDNEVDIIFEGCSSIEALASCTTKELEEYLPISNASIGKLAILFENPSPDTTRQDV